MEQQTPEKKTTVSHNALNYGLVFGVILIIFSLILYMLNLEKVTGLQYLSYLILVVGLILGILNYKNKINKGFITYGQSLGTGVLIALIASSLFAVYFFFFASYIDTDLVKEMMNKSQDQMLEKHPEMTQEQVDVAMSYMKIFMQPWIMSLFYIVVMTFVSFIESLIISIFTQKKDNSFESNFN